MENHQIKKLITAIANIHQANCSYEEAVKRLNKIIIILERQIAFNDLIDSLNKQTVHN